MPQIMIIRVDFNNFDKFYRFPSQNTADVRLPLANVWPPEKRKLSISEMTSDLFCEGLVNEVGKFTYFHFFS